MPHEENNRLGHTDGNYSDGCLTTLHQRLDQKDIKKISFSTLSVSPSKLEDGAHDVVWVLQKVIT